MRILIQSLTEYGSLNLSSTITAVVKGPSTSLIDIAQENVVEDIGVQTVVIGVHLVSYNVCFSGVNKRKKPLLIPFMTPTSSHTLLCTVPEIYFMHESYTLSSYTPKSSPSSTTFKAMGQLFFFLLLITLAIVMGWSIDSLAGEVKL